MFLALFYFFPLIIILVLFVPKLIRFTRKLKACKGKCERDVLIHSVKEKYENTEKFGKPITDLERIRPIIWSQIWSLIKCFSVVFMFPVFSVRMALIFKRGTAITWRLPVSLYEVWQLLFIGLSYFYSYQSRAVVGIITASVVGLSALYIILDDLEKENGTLRILRRPHHKLNLTQTIESGVVLMLSFAALFYALSALQPNSFHPGRLSILNSIYYSLITVATVGYGEIYPASGPAKILVMMEVFLGLLYMLFVVTIFLTVFMQRQIEGIKAQMETEGALQSEGPNHEDATKT